MTSERQPNAVVRTYVESEAANWEHREAATILYEWADLFRHYFFAAGSEARRGLPQPLIAVEALRVDVLAAYRLKENPNGLPYEIIMNARYLDRPLWETLETELHELVHLYQETSPGLDKSKGGYHNAQFVAICEELGLHPRLGTGTHWRPADGQFERLMNRYGVVKPDYAVETPPVVPPGAKTKYWWDDDRRTKKGSSTLVLYTSEACTRTPSCKLRSGRRDLSVHCRECGGDFTPRS